MRVNKSNKHSAGEQATVNQEVAYEQRCGAVTAPSTAQPARIIIAESITELLDTLTKKANQPPETGTVNTRLPNNATSSVKASPSKPNKISAFIQKIGDSAIAVAKKTGLPVELILSQAALESGWGQREILRPDGTTSHNLFGIKPGRYWAGPVVQIITTEYVNGVPRKVEQPFRSYVSYEDALHDYARLLSTSSRYKAVRHAPTPQRAAIEVQKAGYATDPKYAEKLITIMAQFDCPNYSQATPTNAAT